MRIALTCLSLALVYAAVTRFHLLDLVNVHPHLTHNSISISW